VQKRSFFGVCVGKKGTKQGGRYVSVSRRGTEENLDGKLSRQGKKGKRRVAGPMANLAKTVPSGPPKGRWVYRSRSERTENEESRPREGLHSKREATINEGLGKLRGKGGGWVDGPLAKKNH